MVHVFSTGSFRDLMGWGWRIKHQANASVNELKIRHGVLNNPEMAGRSFFYLFEQAYSDCKEAEGPSWRSGIPEEKQRLESHGSSVNFTIGISITII